MESSLGIASEWAHMHLPGSLHLLPPSLFWHGVLNFLPFVIHPDSCSQACTTFLPQFSSVLHAPCSANTWCSYSAWQITWHQLCHHCALLADGKYRGKLLPHVRTQNQELHQHSWNEVRSLQSWAPVWHPQLTQCSVEVSLANKKLEL